MDSEWQFVPGQEGTAGRFGELLNRTREAAFILRAGLTRIEACNRAASGVFGYAAVELVGGSPERLHRDAEAFEFFTRSAARGMNQNGAFMSRVLMRRRDGEEFPALVRSLPLNMEAVEEQVLLLVRDESRRQPFETRDPLEEDMFQLLEETSRVDEVWTGILARLSEEFGWDYAEVWTLDNELLKLDVSWARNDFEDVDRFARMSQSVEFLPGDGLPGKVWLAQTGEWFEDIERVPSHLFRRGFHARNIGLRTWFAMPLHHGDRLAVVLVFASRSKRQVDPDVMNRAELVCRHVASRILQKYDLQAILEQEQAFLQLFQVHPMPIWICEPGSLRIREANGAALELVGYDQDELAGESYKQLLNARDAEGLAGRLAQVDERPRAMGNVLLVCKNGRFVPIRLQVFSIVREGIDRLAFIGAPSGGVKKMLGSNGYAWNDIARDLRTLSPREVSVLDHVLTGKTNREIAAVLNISPRTVEIYRASMLRKMRARSTEHLLSILMLLEA